MLNAIRDTVDLSFPLLTDHTIACDHAYALFGAISRNVPHLHTCREVGVHPIRGRTVGERRLQLYAWSELRLRLRVQEIPLFICLASQRLEIGGSSVRRVFHASIRYPVRMR